MTPTRKQIVVRTAANTSPEFLLTSSQLPTVIQTERNISHGEASTFRLKVTSRNSGLKGSTSNINPAKEASAELVTQMLDFGFETKKRKLSEKFSVSRQKRSFPGKQDITKRILNALQKEPKTARADLDHTEGVSSFIRIKE